MFSLVNKLPKPDELIKFDELLTKKVELPKISAVYVWYDYLGTSLYVGRTVDLRKRINTHLDKSHNPHLRKDITNNRISHIIYFECETEEDAIILERVLIKNSSFVGVYNIQMIADRNEVSKKKYTDFKKKSRSDKKRDVKIPLTNDEYKKILIVSRKEQFSPTQFSTRIFSEMVLSKSEFPDVEYNPQCEAWMHVKLNPEIHDILIELSVSWRCSVRKAAYKILRYALENDNSIKGYNHLI